jgi:hypothetical protein
MMIHPFKKQYTQMKKLLLLPLLVTMLFATANVKKRIPKDATHKFGLVTVLQNNYQKGQPCFLFIPGIGERGSGSYSDLGRIETWGGVQYMWQATDLFGFNAVSVQTNSNYQYGEIQYAVQFAIDSLGADPDRIYTINNSLGGYGFAQQSSVDPNLPKLFAAVIQVVMGPGETTNTAKNIADSKTPIWFFSSADDLTSGTTVYKTDTLYNRVKRMGGNASYTRWVKGGHSVISRVVGSYYRLPNNWKLSLCEAGYSTTATIFCNPPVSVYAWALSNRRGQPIVPPSMSTPIPAPPPPAPTKKLIKTIEFYSDSTYIEKVAA